MSGTHPQPIRQASASRFAGKRGQAGTLLLYPDRLVHVASNVMQVGMFGGAIGALLAQQVAKQRAAGRAAQGGKGVLEVPLSEVSAVNRARQGLNRNVLEVCTVDGTTVRFGVKFDRWAPDLARLVPGGVGTPSPPG